MEPNNPKLTFVTGPNFVPSQQDVDDINTEIQAAQPRASLGTGPSGGLRARIEQEIQESRFTGGKVINQIEGPFRISNLDPGLGPSQVRYNVDFADEFGKVTNYSVNYDPVTGLFGIVKPSSGQR